MTRNGMAIFSGALVLFMLIASYVVGSGLGDETRLPVHWGIDGDADRFAGKWEALLMPAAMVAGVSLLFYFLPNLEPREKGLERSQGLYLWGWAAILLLGVVIEVITFSAALGWGIPAAHLIFGTVGAVLILIGNQLGKSRSMYLVGIRTPWTLASEEVWVKTHRLGGKLFVAAGAVMVLAALFPIPAELLAPVALASVAVAALVPVLYSFILWRREKRTGHASE